jgi:hypothetical protein
MTEFDDALSHFAHFRSELRSHLAPLWPSTVMTTDDDMLLAIQRLVQEVAVCRVAQVAETVELLSDLSDAREPGSEDDPDPDTGVLV